MKISTFRTFVCVVTLMAFAACSAPREVKRVSSDQQIDLSGRWNDTDSKQVAADMIPQALSGNWVTEFQKNNERRPVVVVGLVRNKSHEHISAETFIKDLEKAFIKSGAIRLVQAGEKRNELRGERADQQDFASPESRKKWGRELGADFMLQGSINSIVDKYRDEKVVFYQIDLELSHLETNEIVWIGDKKIKKLVTN